MWFTQFTRHKTARDPKQFCPGQSLVQIGLIETCGVFIATDVFLHLQSLDENAHSVRQ